MSVRLLGESSLYCIIRKKGPSLTYVCHACLDLVVLFCLTIHVALSTFDKHGHPMQRLQPRPHRAHTQIIHSSKHAIIKNIQAAHHLAFPAATPSKPKHPQFHTTTPSAGGRHVSTCICCRRLLRPRRRAPSSGRYCFRGPRPRRIRRNRGPPHLPRPRPRTTSAGARRRDGRR